MKHKILHLRSLVAVALCVIMSMAFVSCGDDDDEPDKNPLVGTWLLQSVDDDGSEYYLQFHFKANGTLETKEWSDDGYVTDEARYSILDDMLIIYYEDGYSERFKFKVSGNTLILYENGDDKYGDVFIKQ